MGVSLEISHKRGPREHLMFSDHMTEAKFDTPIRETYLGQAHIAGTGPEGTTCRECKYWHAWKNTRNSPYSENPPTPVAPGYYSKNEEERANEIKKARCNRPIANKARKAIPHFAKACRLFVASENPPPAKRPE